jgi:ATP-binding cassette subfamily F protein uup
VATLTVALEGQGRATVYAGRLERHGGAARGGGGVSRRRGAGGRAESAETGKTEAGPKPRPRRPSGLTFTEAHRLEALPGEIARLEAEIAKLSEFLSDPEAMAENPAKAEKASAALTERQAKLMRPRRNG